MSKTPSKARRTGKPGDFRKFIAVLVLVAIGGFGYYKAYAPRGVGAWAKAILSGESFQSAHQIRTRAAADEEVQILLGMAGNKALAEFLDQDNDFVKPAPKISPLNLAWKDGRGALELKDCWPTGRYDPTIPDVEFHISSPIDYAMGEAMEEHFGCPEALQSLMWRSDLDLGKDELLNRLSDAAAKHWVTYLQGELRVDLATLVKDSVPLVSDFAWQMVRTFPTIPNQLERDPAIVSLVSLVQLGVPYTTIPDRPNWINLGVRTPLATLMNGGDCDSKCLLLAAMVRAIYPEMPIVLVPLDGAASEHPHEEGHMVIGLGIKPNACDTTLEHDGKIYVIVEATSMHLIGTELEKFTKGSIGSVTVVP